LFIVSATTLIPLIYSNSLYLVSLVLGFTKENGETSSLTKLVLALRDSDPNVQPYSGTNVS
jgi:hypothetical protein